MRSRDLDLDREVNSAGEYALKPGCWVEPYSNGYARIMWTAAEKQGDKDWVALYSDVYKDNGDYISGAWQWARATLPITLIKHMHLKSMQVYKRGITIYFHKALKAHC